MNAAQPFLVLLPFGLLDRSTRTEVSEGNRGQLADLVNRRDHERHKVLSSERLKEAHMRTVTWFTTALVAVFFLALPAVAADITAEAVAEATGLGAGDRAKLQAGEIVSTEIEGTTGSFSTPLAQSTLQIYGPAWLEPGLIGNRSCSS